MSKVPARWEFVRRAVEMRDASGKETLIFGNGDVLDIDDARRKCEEFCCDGVMLGRAIFGNPWLFSGSSRSDLGNQTLNSDLFFPPVRERLRVLVKHAKLFEELLGGYKSFAMMKKHLKSYLSGIDGAVDLRAKLMDANNAGEVEKIVSEFLKNRIIKA